MFSCRPLEADLHNHTTFSDGEFTPEEIVGAAGEMGLKAVAVTDHDTLDGLSRALAAGKKAGIEVVCGVEATVRFTEPFFRGSLHMLLYFPEAFLENPEFTRAAGDVLAEGRGDALTRARIEAINRVFAPGMSEPILPRPLEPADVYAHGSRISRRHFALALKTLGVTDRETISRIIGNDSPAYIPSGIPLGALRPFLQSWPVIRILAHPAAGSFPGKSHYKEVLPPLETVEKLLPEFLDAGLDGMEICYPGHTPELMERVDAIRREVSLPLYSGGSDCHDATTRPAGASGVPYSVMEEFRASWKEKGAI